MHKIKQHERVTIMASKKRATQIDSNYNCNELIKKDSENCNNNSH